MRGSEGIPQVPADGWRQVAGSPSYQPVKQQHIWSGASSGVLPGPAVSELWAVETYRLISICFLDHFRWLDWDRKARCAGPKPVRQCCVWVSFASLAIRLFDGEKIPESFDLKIGPTTHRCYFAASKMLAIEYIDYTYMGHLFLGQDSFWVS